MAVCKIIPIKQSKGIQACKDYISDENKVISSKKTNTQQPLVNASEMNTEEEERFVTPMDLHTVLAYMKNDEKTHRADEIQKKYISGYMCNPETAVQEFLNTKEQNLFRQGKTLADETGNWAYHIIQSFPEGINISDDEVHQCGRELCEKLGLYQAVICSHIHPVINEEGEVSGKCKHNHILINSHMQPDKLDPKNPKLYKYHDCKETYAQLQQWNDEISLAHGLPIIRNPDMDRQYSWFKSRMENKDASWTKQVARDIKNTMRFCSDWEQFKKQMTEQGYFIREAGKTITYYTPEHTESNKQQIREKRLGREYTKTELERYWDNIRREKGNPKPEKDRASRVNLVKALIRQYGENLFAEVEITNKKNPYTLDVPLKKSHREKAEETVKTYFEADKTYNLCTSDHVPIAEVAGQDLFDYYEQLRKEREKREKKNASYIDAQEYYFDNTKINSKTKKPYRIRLWDENGRRRTTIELLCILAIVVIKQEHALVETTPTFSYKNDEGKYIYAKTDWKLQNMYNTMTLAREMKVENASDVDKKLDRTGKEVARLRKQVRLLTEQYNQMDTIYDNLMAMESVKEICEQIYNMPDGEEKDKAIEAHAAQLDKYKAAKRYLHTKNINTSEQIEDFIRRYQSTASHLQEVQGDLKTMNEEYRSLKKIEYNLTLAQNNYYCYGPNHERFLQEKNAQQTNQYLGNT